MPLHRKAPVLPSARLSRRHFGAVAAGGLIVAWGQGLLTDSVLAADLTQLGTVSRMQKISGATHDKDSRSLTIGDKVYRGDLLWTRSHGQLRIDLLDGSNLSLGENAEVALDDSMLSNGSSAFMRILNGAFRFSSGGGEKKSMPPKIGTPFAVLSLRGTEVYGVRAGRDWAFFVSNGQVEVSNDACSVTLNEGEGTEIGPNGKMEAPKRWGAAKVAKMKGMLRY